MRACGVCEPPVPPPHPGDSRLTHLHARAEVRSIVNDLRNEKTAKKAYKGAAIGFFLILVLAMGAIFGVSLAAGQALKDSKIESAPPAEGEEGGVAKAVMETVDGVAVAVSVAEGESDIFDIVAMDMNELKDLKSVSVFVDMTADASIGDWVPYVATLAAAYKKGNEVAFLKCAVDAAPARHHLFRPPPRCPP